MPQVDIFSLGKLLLLQSVQWKPQSGQNNHRVSFVKAKLSSPHCHLFLSKKVMFPPSQGDPSMGWRSRGGPCSSICFSQLCGPFFFPPCFFLLIRMFCICWWLQLEHCSLSHGLRPPGRIALSCNHLPPDFLRVTADKCVEDKLNHLQLSQPKATCNPKINANTQIPACEPSYLMGKSWLGILTARCVPCVHLGPLQVYISLLAWEGIVKQIGALVTMCTPKYSYEHLINLLKCMFTMDFILFTVLYVWALWAK